jgi:ComF family protein
MLIRSLSQIVRFALPPRCAGCGAIIGQDHALCLPCWTSMDFLTGQGCMSCGVPMDLPDMVCGPCLARPPDHDGVRAAVVYAGVARDIAVRLKHGRRLGLARLMARAMSLHVPPSCDIILPVPLHRMRLWRRGFNQSLQIARALSLPRAIPIVDDLLIRTRATPSLGGLGPGERDRAVRGVFAVSPARKSEIKGRHVVLVDDVYTTGATANGCARVLKRAGAGSVTVLCWARVIRSLEESN